jgi:WD40 repeat protein/serine/threonine protein kinase
VDQAKVELDELFCNALEQTSLAERAAYLDRVCGHDFDLRRRVERLLEANAEANSFLAARPGVSAATCDSPAEAAGTVIGPYKLLEQIGEGGMGVVYLAEQERPVRRKIALKVIKPGMDTKQVAARFEAERQALAMMDHTNIARVLDAGATDTGRPFFVMELVKGIPITQFCDDNQMTPRERLELFITVCQAVQHAHQKGIIHRDLKPSNVLVTPHDGVPLVKVIDFGIAKALGQERLTEKTLCTGFAQMLGTPLYMSPEQAERSGQDADTRTDIYALGVLLYELLTGTTPFDRERLKEASYEEIRRIIREEEPAKPSTRISTLGQAATKVSTNRKSEPRRLSQLFRGELDWIVMKALEKDRNRRYDTASSFAADVQRYLHNEPVQACPPSAMYRFRKFARRNQVALTTTAAIALMVLLAAAGLAVSTVLTWQANEGLRRSLYFERIARADREWSANNLRGMEQLLDACPSDLRDFEWGYLHRLRYKSRPPLHHGAALLSLALSPDGRRIASGSQDGTVKVWDAKTGKELPAIPAHAEQARSVAFSPDGQFLASGSWDKTVKLWDAQTGRNRLTLEGQDDKVQCIAFSPDGKYLASAGGQFQPGEVKIWNVTTGQTVHTLPHIVRTPHTITGHDTQVYCVAFSPDGQRLASGGADSRICLWDVQTGEQQHILLGHHRSVYGVAFSRDGRLLASCGGDYTGRGDGDLRLWNGVTGEEIGGLRGIAHGLWCLAFSPNGQRLATGDAEENVKLWDVASLQELLTLRGCRQMIRAVAFSPDGHRLYSCATDGNVRVWDATPIGANEDEGCLTLRGHGGQVGSVAFHPRDPNIVGSTDKNGFVKLWNTRTGNCLLTQHAHQGGADCLAFSPDGHRFATVGSDETLKIWNTANGNVIQQSRRVYESDLKVAFLPDGKQIVSAGWARAVRIWNAESAKLVHPFPPENWLIRDIAISPNGSHVASGCMNGTVRIWDLKTRQPVVGSPVQHPLGARAVAFRGDGKQLASAGMSGQIVGYYYQAGSTSHGFLLEQGSYTTLDVPGALYTYASGINASGQIVGTYYDAAKGIHGFLLNQGNYTTLDVPGSAWTQAHAINDSGQIVGSYRDGAGQQLPGHPRALTLHLGLGGGVTPSTAGPQPVTVTDAVSGITCSATITGRLSRVRLRCPIPLHGDPAKRR